MLKQPPAKGKTLSVPVELAKKFEESRRRDDGAQARRQSPRRLISRSMPPKWTSFKTARRWSNRG